MAAQVRVGSRFEESSHNGISHFLEHMLYRGTRAYPTAHKLALAFESIGGNLVATTSSDTGTLEVGVPPENLARVLPLFAEVFRAPVFNGIETERGIVREEILEGLDDRGNCIASDDLLRSMLFPGHALGKPISGPLEHLERFDVPSLERHHHRFYCGANAALAICGPIDPQQALDALEREFAGLHAGDTASCDAPAALRGPVLCRVPHHASQTEVTLGFRAPGLSFADEPAMDLLARVLDDGMATRLYHQLCDERGLCYDVSGNYEPYTDSGLLELVAETGHQRVASVVELLLAIVRDLGLHGPSEQELSAAKRRHGWQLVGMLDSPSLLVEYFLGEELSGNRRTPLEREAQLARVTVEEVRDVARRWFVREALGLVLVGFPKKSELGRIDKLVAAFD